MTSLSWGPVISSGRRETSHTAAPISPRHISADWVRTTWCGTLRTFIYIWREKDSELQIFFKYSLYFPKIVETMSSISYTLNLMSFFGTPSIKQWGLYVLYLNLSLLVIRWWWHQVIKITTISHQNIALFHTFSWDAHAWLNCHTVRKLNKPWKNSSHGEELRPPAHSPAEQPANSYHQLASLVGESPSKWIL